MHRSDDHAITTVEQLAALHAAPSWRAERKVLSALDVHCRKFISLSPFVVLGTQAADGTADCSPRGDAPGFVAVLDDRTLLIPDRPGNNRLDTLKNLLGNESMAALFMVPGVTEMLRVNGAGRITADPALLQPLSVNGRMPKTGIVLTVREAFLQCSKAAVRSRLWSPTTRSNADLGLPSLSQMLSDQIPGLSVEESERMNEVSMRDRLY